MTIYIYKAVVKYAAFVFSSVNIWRGKYAKEKPVEYV